MSTLASVVAAKNVDLPTLGLPTSPMRRADPPHSSSGEGARRRATVLSSSGRLI